MMMAKVDEGSSGVIDDFFIADDECNDVVLDRESFLRVMGEPTELSQGSVLEDLSSIDTVQDLYCKIPMGKSNPGTFVAQMEDACITDRDRTSRDASRTESSSCETNTADIPDILSVEYLLSSDDPPHFPYSSGFKSLTCDGGRIVNIVDEGTNPKEDFMSMMPPYVDLVGDDFGNYIAENGSRSSCFLNDQVGVTKCNDVHETGNGSNKLLKHFSKRKDDIRVMKNLKSIRCNERDSRDSEVIDDVTSRKYYWDAAMSGEAPIKKEAIGIRDFHHVLQVSDQPSRLPRPKIKKEISHIPKMEYEVPKFTNYSLSNITHQRVRKQITHDDDSDVYILEDMSAPARPNPTVSNGKLVAASQFSTSKPPINQMAVGHSRLRTNDERAIFQVAVEDLSQPKSETTPPGGLLAVSLLKHQRIALSWMVHMETKNACCCGGILADDQGLGKTISTIALILKERSPSSKASKPNKEQSEMEMLNFAEDECHKVLGGKTFLQTNGRPRAGTLIVCPTSVLRQWSEELRNKVSSDADLSVLVYHGSNRTKDPLKLAKYDVVVTTYAIVSMEVPKQPVINEKDDPIATPFKGFSSRKKRKLFETRKPRSTLFKGFSSSKRRKLFETRKPRSSKKSSTEGVDSELLEIISGPLAKVGWFRVVLDEAQCIKNHRTQVARACWGLCAKRRWCLSGTPIQNAIDDLYSYFRFLRHEPYADFGTFCEKIKVPIHMNPKDGYKKLQAVLKTILLRRTKGTFIDGEPIINLPPKTIELKKVEFSMEERNFYRRLEADSRAQFQEYAAAGTVKQNYFNILLMLLRLRQACDHPLLVNWFNSNSQMTSSVEMAKKLPREKQIFLLNCLEGSLAMCGICSDPPEDALVTVCGHVYCHQCICEQMIGDDAQCPTKNCKTHLSMSRVFSIATLRVAISDQQSVGNIATSSDYVLEKASDSRSSSCPQSSSKIKAALKILLSISKPQNPAALNMSPVLRGCDSWRKNVTSDMKRDSNNFVGEKAIVFSQWTRMLDLLEASLKDFNIQYRRLDGTMPIVARDRAVKDFNSLPQVTVMIMSLKAASLGLNMVAACHVILLDLWWNPTTEDQAIDRAHRIGQTRPVSVFRLTVKDTVEDRILALQQKKRELVASAFGEDGTGGQQTRLTVEDLNYLFRV